MSPFRADPIEDAAALDALEPEWQALWRRAAGASPFTSPAWLLPWWRAFAPGELRTVALRRGGDLVALAPLWLERGPLGSRLLPLGLGLSDLFDVLADPAEDCGGPLAEAIADALAGCDRCEFEELPEGAAALRLPVPRGCVDMRAAQSARPVLPVSAPLPARKRRKLAMARHRLERRGGVVEPVGPEAHGRFLSDLVRLHSARWAERGEPGVLADPRVRAFHAEALPRLHAAGLARLHELRIGGEVAGVYYGLLHGASAYAYLGGFDPRFAFESPGTALLGHAIDEAGREGAESFDLLRGQEPYKYEWGAADRPNLRRSWRRA